MKFLVTAKPAPLPPPVDTVRAAQEWIQANLDDGTFQAVYGFPSRGGCSIGEYESHEQLMDLLMEYPLSPFVEYEVTALVEVDAAFDRFIPYVEQVSAQLAGQPSG